VENPPLLSLPKSLLENIVTKTKKENTAKKSSPSAEPWISMRRGLIVITLTSIGMAVLTAWEVVPVKGWMEGILWGLLFGALIWVIFFGMIFFNRLIRR
jgi:hypothetical protein